jgi:crotonobetainyl-CoA:carnitine CoA-transferase CaiB-like acyl-CoA transferase
MAELGADVVKVESRTHPEALRAYDYPGQRRPSEPSGARTTAVFAGLSRSVRSVSFDPTTAGGQHVLRALVAQSQAVIENLGPGVLEAWGLGFSELTTVNPRLVLLSISGYGRTGPLAGYRAYASNICNFIGLAEAWGPDGTYLDFLAGLHGASAMVAGLAHAQRTAGPVHLDLAQTEAGAATLAPLYLDFLANRRDPHREPNDVPGALLSAVVRCAGPDVWLAVELEDLEDWRALCRCLERPDLETRAPGSGHARGDVVRALEDWAACLTPLQASWRLQRAGLAAAPVQNAEDLWRDPQHRFRGALVEIEHPDLGAFEYPAPVGRLEGTPAAIRRRGPRLGEHTLEVLGEWLELGLDPLKDLVAAGAVWQADCQDGAQ